MGYKTLFEQIKTVCAWNSLNYITISNTTCNNNILTIPVFTSNICVSNLQHTQRITCHSIFQVDMVYILLSLLILYHCYMYPGDTTPNYPQYLLGSNNPQDTGR